MDAAVVMRKFNRFYARCIGVLVEPHLDTGRPLGPSRVLFEVGPDGVRVADMRRRLGLDSGYLSRLLRRLQHEGLVTVTPDPTDGRQRVVHLTPAGRHERHHLDRKSEESGRRLVGSLSERRQTELATALTTAERLLRAATVDVDIVDPRSPQARSALAQYFGELDDRFPNGFDPGDDGAASTVLRAPGGAFVIMHSDGVAFGCGGVQRIDEVTGEIKRMWISPDWRRLGLGARLLTGLENTARELGYTCVVLDTNATLVEAIAMYERAGYRPIERYNDNPYAQRWFTKDL